MKYTLVMYRASFREDRDYTLPSAFGIAAMLTVEQLIKNIADSLEHDEYNEQEFLHLVFQGELLDTSSLQLDKGVASIHVLWPYSCPEGMDWDTWAIGEKKAEMLEATLRAAVSGVLNDRKRERRIAQALAELEKNRKSDVDREAKERADFERLKAKFGG